MMDREETVVLVAAVTEIAAAVKRIEEKLEGIDGRFRIVDLLASMRGEPVRANVEVMPPKTECELAHHDTMLRDHERRISELEAARSRA